MSNAQLRSVHVVWASSPSQFDVAKGKVVSQENPFAAPELADDSEIDEIRSKARGERQYLIPLKWLFVCTVSAAPSFGWGMTIGQTSTGEIVGMLAGITVFVLLYSLAEFTETVRNLKENKDLRRSLRIGYVTRIGISIFFPLGLFLDMFVGIFSVQVVTISANALGVMEGGRGDFGVGNDFSFFFVTTLVQGVFLNCVLFAYILIIYAIMRAVR
ncbi:MAG: hypothetical protein AAGG44_07080, partial [Planctomycetota bacterium]